MLTTAKSVANAWKRFYSGQWWQMYHCSYSCCAITTFSVGNRQFWTYWRENYGPNAVHSRLQKCKPSNMGHWSRVYMSKEAWDLVIVRMGPEWLWTIASVYKKVANAPSNGQQIFPTEQTQHGLTDGKLDTVRETVEQDVASARGWHPPGES